MIPLVSCLCPTYEPRESLAEAIECFDTQEYPPDRRELIILDDGPGAILPEHMQDNVRYVEWGARFPSLPRKYNCLAAIRS